VVMLDGIEVEFPVLDRGSQGHPELSAYAEDWNRLLAQLKPSPHQFTNL
jgi:hypothetical protein